MRKLVRGGGSRYRYDRGEARAVDLASELPDDAIRRALREAAGPDPRVWPRVTELRVSGHSLRDLTPLASLPSLQRLWLRAPSVTSLEPLGGLTALKELTLVDVPVAELAPLGALSRLERLRIERMPVDDVTPLAQLHRLTDLCLRRTGVSDLRPLTNLPRLRILELTDGTTLATLQPLEEMRALGYVNLAGTRVLRVGDLRRRRPGLHLDGLACAPTVRSATRGVLPLDARAAATEIAYAAERILRWPCRVTGLALRDGQAAPFQRNPWRLPAKTSLEHAVERLWGPFARRAPQFGALLERELAAIAQVSPLGGDEPVLVYVLDRRCACHPSRRVQVLMGRAPRASDRLGAGAFRLPLALRELYSVHGGLVTDDVELYGPDRLRSLSSSCRGRLQQFRRANRGQLPDQFRLFLVDGEGGKVFDLEHLDGRGDPLVRRWYVDTHEVAGQAPFWEWFEDHAPEQLLHQMI